MFCVYFGLSAHYTLFPFKDSLLADKSIGFKEKEKSSVYENSIHLCCWHVLCYKGWAGFVSTKMKLEKI